MALWLVRKTGFIAQELKTLADATDYANHMRLVSDENPDKIRSNPMKMFPILVKVIQGAFSTEYCVGSKNNNTRRIGARYGRNDNRRSSSSLCSYGAFSR